MWRRFTEPPVDRHAGIFDGRDNARVYKCFAGGSHTVDAVPVMLTGIPLSKVRKSGDLDSGTYVLDKTLFDIFSDNGYHVAYNNIDQRTGLFGLTDLWAGRFPDFPEQSDLNTLLSQQHTPFFVVIHSWFTHEPYSLQYREVCQTLLRKNRDNKNVDGNKNIYMYGVDAFERELLKLMFKLRIDAKTIKDMLIVMSSDHGDLLGETVGDVPRIGHGDGTPEDDKRLVTHPEIYHVPLVFYHPSFQPIVDTNVSTHHIDIAPTILSLMKIPVPDYMEGNVLW
jgi:phosphoglycerol transferase MdoB-like AlkP superfamily enzyme